MYLRNENIIFAIGAHSSPMLRLTKTDKTFTRSDGTVVSRLYERLTKASRRRGAPINYDGASLLEESYRRGVYDAYKALQEELS